MKTIFILGGSGQIGQFVISHLKEEFIIINLDLKEYNKEASYSYLGSVSDACLVKDILKKHQPDIVLHLASSLILADDNRLEFYLSHFQTALFPLIIAEEIMPSSKIIILSTEWKRLNNVDSYKFAKSIQDLWSENKKNVSVIKIPAVEGTNEHLDSLKETSISKKEVLQLIRNCLLETA